MPARQLTGAAGFDLGAHRRVVVPAYGRQVVGTGCKIAVPHGTYARVAPRSGRATARIDVRAGVGEFAQRALAGGSLR